MEPSEDNRPITWLELYMIYRIRGYHKPIANPENGAFARATLDKQLKQFKKDTRTVVDKTMCGCGDACLFKPQNGKNNALKGVAILGKHASLAFNVVTENDEQEAIHKALVKLNRQITNVKTDEFLKGKRKLTPHVIQMNGKTGWDSSLPIVRNENECSDKWDQHNLNHKTPEVNTTFYRCPKAECFMNEPSTAEAFRPNDLDKQVRCIRCHRTSPARKWLCQCNVPWVTCEVHQTYYCNKVIKQKNQKETEKSQVNLRPCVLKRRRNNESGRNKARSKRARTNMICIIDTGGDGNEVELDYMPPPKIRRILGPIIHSRFPMASRSSGSRGSAGAVLDTAR